MTKVIYEIYYNHYLVLVKKFIAISFLFIYMISTTELRQLLKSPLLVGHFVSHKKDSRDITLWQFLYIHYAMDDIRDADYDEDMKLPFKSHENCVSAISNFYFSPPDSLSILPFKQIVEQGRFPIDDGFLLTSFLSSIWQPPRA